MVDSDTLTSRPTRRRCVVFLVAALVLLAAAGWLAWCGIERLTHSVTDDAFVDADMVDLAPKVEGQIVEMLVEDCQPITAGQLLCRIDRTLYDHQVEIDKANVATAQANLAEAEAQLMLLKAEVPQEIRQAEHLLAVAQELVKTREHELALMQSTVEHNRGIAQHAVTSLKAVWDDAVQDYKDIQKVAASAATREEVEHRRRTLVQAESAHAQGLLRLAQADKEQLRVAIAERALASAKSQAAKAEADLALAKTGDDRIAEQTKKVAVLSAEIVSTQRALARAESLLAFTEVKAPFDGVVARRFQFAGDYATPGTAIFSLYNPENLYVTVHLEETRLEGREAGPSRPAGRRRLRRAVHGARAVGRRGDGGEVLADPAGGDDRGVHEGRPARARPRDHRPRWALRPAPPGPERHRANLPRAGVLTCRRAPSPETSSSAGWPGSGGAAGRSVSACSCSRWGRAARSSPTGQIVQAMQLDRYPATNG